MSLRNSVRRTCLTVLLLVLTMAPTAMTAFITTPVAYTVDTENGTYGANGNYTNNNATHGVFYLDSNIVGSCTCSMNMWSGDYNTPAANGLTQYTFSVDINDVNANFLEGASQVIYVTN